ncbi:MAG: TonB-dependent receptor plug domain-containing protein [Woeseiaceae bacterium]
MSKFTAGLVASIFLIVLSRGAVHADDIEEIIVYADFRERTVDDVPASITVLDAEQISELAVQHFEELVNAIPNLNWSGDGHRARYFQIRGIGELEQYQGAPNPSVGFLVDDIDYSGIGTIATLFDMESVEVLRGPQGSRYGANALAGLIYMRSTEPSAERNGRMQLQVGDDDMLAAGVAFGGSLSEDDSTLFRFSAHHHSSNGFRDNAYLGRDDSNGRDETSLRGKLSASLTDTLLADVVLAYSDVDNGYDAFAIDNSLTMLSDKPGRDAQQSIGAAVTLSGSGSDRFDFKSITSVADSDIDFSFDADWGNAESWAPVTYDYVSVSERGRRTISQEFRWSSSDAGRIWGDSTDWLLGVYGLQLKDDLQVTDTGEYYDPGYDFADSLDSRFDSRYEAGNVAAFGQLQHDLTERTSLGGGLRLERRDSDYNDSDALEADPAETMWGGELTLQHQLDSGAMAYLAFSRGYKAGGINLGSVTPERREFDSETLLSFEAGFKTTALDGALRLNVAAFINQHQDQQVRSSFQLVPGDPTTFVFFTDNAAEGESIGLEADINWQVSATVSLYANVGLLDATFEDFVTPQVDLTGREQAHAPSYTFAAGFNLRRDNGLFAAMDVSARDAFFFDVSHDQQSQSYLLTNLRVGYDADSWMLQLWARNLLDEDYAVRGFYFGNEPPDFPNALYTRQGDPRQLGVTFEWRF